jgi:hypothetical protein
MLEDFKNFQNGCRFHDNIAKSKKDAFGNFQLFVDHLS